MKNDPSRTDRQTQCLRRFKEVNFKGTLEAATGFGKTRVAIMLILKMISLLPYTPDIIVIVNTTYLKNQWLERLESNGISGVTVEVINTAIKNKYKCHLLILDEIHSYLATKFKQVFTCVEYDWILGLSATLDQNDPKMQTVNTYCPIFDTVSLEECEQRGWVSKFVVYNLAVSLSGHEKADYKSASSKFNRGFAIFNHDFPTMMACLSNVDKAKEFAEIKKGHESYYGEIMGAARNANAGMQRRKQILYNSESKIRAIVELVAKFPDRRILIFNQTTSMCEDVSDAINMALGDICTTYHSDVKGELEQIKGHKKPKRVSGKEVRRRRVKSLVDENSPIRVLSAAIALDQGADIAGVDMGIIGSGSSKNRQALQRMGRIIRQDENKRAILVELYVTGTKDRDWLRTRQKDIPKRHIRWITNVEGVV